MSPVSKDDPRGLAKAKLYIHRRVATLAARYLHYEPNCTFTQRDTAKQCKTRVQIWARTSNGTFRCFSVLLPPKMARWVRLTNDRAFVCHDIRWVAVVPAIDASFRRTPKSLSLSWSASTLSLIDSDPRLSWASLSGRVESSHVWFLAVLWD